MLFVRQEVFDFDAECNVPLTYDVADIRTQFEKKIGLTSRVRPVNPQSPRGRSLGRTRPMIKPIRTATSAITISIGFLLKLFFRIFHPGIF